MKILTNSPRHIDLKPTAHLCSMYFSYIEDNVFNLAVENPDIIITDDDVTRVAKEFPTIKFIAPDAKFPSYNLYNGAGFNSLELIELDESKNKATYEICFINTRNVESKLFAQQLKAEYKGIHIYGNGFGINSIKKDILNVNTCKIYQDYDICAADDIKEAFKIYAMEKECIPIKDLFDKLTPDCYDENWQRTAMNHTNFDLLSNILIEAEPLLSKEILEIKEKVHNAKN